MLRSLSFLAMAAYVSAQSLSSGCISALSAIALNADAASCLNPVALVSILSGNSSASIVPSVDNWLTGVCGSPACSNQTISQVVANVTTGCGTELGTTGIGADDSSSIATLVQQYYPTVRKLLCLKDGNAKCITQTLESVEKVVGPLSLTNILNIYTNPPSNISAELTCTNCFKEAYNVISKDIPSIAEGNTAIQQQCGASFTDGTTPSGISQSASTVTGTPSQSNSNDNSNSAISFVPAGIYVSGLLIASTVVTILA